MGAMSRRYGVGIGWCVWVEDWVVGVGGGFRVGNSEVGVGMRFWDWIGGGE